MNPANAVQFGQPFSFRCGHPLLVAAGLLALLLFTGAPAAWAQADADEGGVADYAESDNGGQQLTDEEAARLLATALPAAPEARYSLLQRQYRAAQQLEERGRTVDIARQLMDAGHGMPGGEAWIVTYLNAEFTWGSSGKAFAESDRFVSDSSLSLVTRASVALRQAYFAAQGHDRALLNRLWSRADDMAGEAIKQVAGKPSRLPIERLQVRAEIERWRGDTTAAVASLREAIGIGRKELQAARSRAGGARSPAVLDTYGWLDGSLGMLTFALVRQGRSREAIDIAESNIALWRSGQLSDGLGARWNYRLAMAQNSIQQFDSALAAARLSDEMLQKAGSSAASHTRWHARQEVVRALIGLKRWPEADAAYREFLAAMPADVLARTRASDWRLLALLAAKNGRLDEALQLVERSHRYRVRLYGEHHPQTQEAAGVRAVVRLLRGDTGLAMADYEELFSATLDNPGGWKDLDLRGVRGYVFGIAFDEFMHYVIARAMRGEPVDDAMAGRAMQIADRNNLSVTQRAIIDSTARVLAATPALKALLEQEQAQRLVVAAQLGTLNGLLGQEDRLRREKQTEAFKALPEAEHKAHDERLRAVRDQIKAGQAASAAARTTLLTHRTAISSEFPAYADLVTPPIPSPAQLISLLAPGEAVLVIHPGDEATLIWLITADGGKKFAATRLTRSDIARQVTALRAQLDLGKSGAGREPPLPLADLHALYRELLAPLSPLLNDVRSLIVATQGPLAALPLATLVTQPPTAGTPPAWLLRQMAVTQLPSPSALQALRRIPQPQTATKALKGFGDPLFRLANAAPQHAGKIRTTTGMLATGATLPAGAVRYDAEWGFRYADIPPLPETRGELLAIATALGADPATDLLLGAQATRRAVLDANLLDRRVVAFATHGLMPGELPGISKPALAMAANADERDSPLLELDDVLGLRLNAQWVLLSACNTAAGEAGGSAMSGLVRGFFFAGARSVLATHWAVESESAATITGTTLKVQADGALTRAESLRQTQLAIIDGRLGSGRWQHPFYWAPYALFGDPAR